MEACPTCGAACRGAAVCPRCRTDLRSILAVEAAAVRSLAAAWAALRRKDPRAAWTWALRGCSLHRTPAGLQMLALAAVASGRYREAVNAWRACTPDKAPQEQAVHP